MSYFKNSLEARGFVSRRAQMGWGGNSSQSRKGGRGGNNGFRGGRGASGGRGGRKIQRQAGILDFIETASKLPTKLAAHNQIHHSFSDFGFDDRLTEIIIQKGYATPTPIQDRAIPEAMAGLDVIGLASTGSGKTAAFLLPLINKILMDNTQNVLILAPTRELAMQIETELHTFTRGMRIWSALCVGGMSMSRQIMQLRRHPHFVIGTPGRIQDLVDRGHIPLRVFQNVVLDEVDHMLDMGFVEPITEIMRAVPSERQTLFFSATMPPKIRGLANEFLVNPVTIELSVGQTAPNVEQKVIRPDNRGHKLDLLHDILIDDSASRVIIFNETKRDVEDLTIELQTRGFKAVSIHGDKRQRERTFALNDFSNGRVNVLVATDVAARGLDIKNVSHVINYSVPQTFDDYIHRIGRTGRAGTRGTAVTFI